MWIIARKIFLPSEIKIKISDTLEKMKVKLYFTRVINRVDTLWGVSFVSVLIVHCHIECPFHFLIGEKANNLSQFWNMVSLLLVSWNFLLIFFFLIPFNRGWIFMYKNYVQQHIIQKHNHSLWYLSKNLIQFKIFRLIPMKKLNIKLKC